MIKKNFQKGQSMFELLIAVFVIGIALTAIVSLVTTSISNTSFSRDRTLAAKYTQEASEWLREQRDLDWGQFTARGSAGGSSYCLQTLTWDQGNCSETEYIADTTMVREVTLVYPASSPDTVEARITTYWQDSSGRHESRISTYFSNWRTK